MTKRIRAARTQNSTRRRQLRYIGSQTIQCSRSHAWRSSKVASDFFQTPRLNLTSQPASTLRLRVNPNRHITPTVRFGAFPQDARAPRSESPTPRVPSTFAHSWIFAGRLASDAAMVDDRLRAQETDATATRNNPTYIFICTRLSKLQNLIELGPMRKCRGNAPVLASKHPA